jgi:hypothetical protein
MMTLSAISVGCQGPRFAVAQLRTSDRDFFPRTLRGKTFDKIRVAAQPNVLGGERAVLGVIDELVRQQPDFTAGELDVADYRGLARGGTDLADFSFIRQ